jgi:hypothetical protein
MARKKTPPEYGESDYLAVSICTVVYIVVSQFSDSARGVAEGIWADLQGP